MNHILRILINHLERGEHLVQASILTHEGSTPRSAGSRMLLGAGDETMQAGARIVAGTVGGGLVEARVMEAGALVLASGLRRVESFELTGELAAGADMICGGRLRVLLERLGPADLGLLRGLAQALDVGKRCLRLIPLDQPNHLNQPEEQQAQARPTLLLPEGRSLGAALPPELEQSARQAGEGIAAPVALKHAEAAYALEPWAAASPLYIFGAGHVSRPTAQIAALVGFRVTVLDDRAEFANAGRFPQAKISVLGGYADCFAGLYTGQEAFVVIVTRGHVHDAEVLAQALRTRAGYIGMIGSSRKREAVYQRLRGQGFTDADLASVRCPIGLNIGAETPEEIAVSINAELVQVRAGKTQQ
ncbi:XdhC family aldehyde oxidoreductase maturation factor [Humidesulfovibrio sp.]